MVNSSSLEARLEALTLKFVAEIVATLRAATFAEVAALAPVVGGAPRLTRGGSTKTARVRSSRASPQAGAAGAGKTRQTAERRAELGKRVLQALVRSETPMGVRAIASEVGVATDLLTVPLRELRAAGRIEKHGEKRATTYSAA